MSEWIYGIHPVLGALRSGRRAVRLVVLAQGRRDGRLEEVSDAARAAGVVVERRQQAALERVAGSGAAHQGVAALVEAPAYATVEDVLRSANRPQLFVVLDSVEDPRNLGAVIRSAAAAGVGGLFVPQHRAAGLTPVCLKAAAGAVESVPIARVGNIVAFLKLLKKEGIWIVGLDAAGDSAWTAFDLTQPTAFVLGGEGRGLRRLARQTCDALLAIPLRGGVESLNVSVAAGIILFEAVRQRLAGQEKIF